MQRNRAEAERIVDENFTDEMPQSTREFLIRRYSEYDPRYCQNCHGTGNIFNVEHGFVSTTSCICRHIVRRNEDVERKFKESNIPLLYRNADLNKWVNMGVSESEVRLNQASFHTVQSYTEQLGRMRQCGHGIFFCGPHGVGKTFLACSVGNIAIQSRFSVRYYTMSTIIHLHIRGWYEDDMKPVVDAIRSCDFLIIDDLDKIYRTKTGIETSLFDNLLRERLQYMMPCIITTNRPLTQASNDYTVAIHSMLLEKCAELVFLGADHRKGLSDKVRRDILNDNS